MTDGQPRIPLLIDCDTGIDDSLALLYACASPEAEHRRGHLRSGNVEATEVARNTLAVLELAGRIDIEVAIGRAGARSSGRSRPRPRRTARRASATPSCRHRAGRSRSATPST